MNLGQSSVQYSKLFGDSVSTWLALLATLSPVKFRQLLSKFVRKEGRCVRIRPFRTLFFFWGGEGVCVPKHCNHYHLSIRLSGLIYHAFYITWKLNSNSAVIFWSNSLPAKSAQPGRLHPNFSSYPAGSAQSAGLTPQLTNCTHQCLTHCRCVPANQRRA